jgi:hypothetical protein
MRRTALLAALGVLLLAPLAPRPASAEDILLGRVSPASILAVSPAWQEEHDAYTPDPEDVKILAELSRKARVDVYFGSWCGDSQREVPRFLKILDVAVPRRLKVRYLALDRTKSHPARLVEGVGIERVPTFVLHVGGREIGRIVETPQSTLEHDLAVLVAGVPPGRP